MSHVIVLFSPIPDTRYCFFFCSICSISDTGFGIGTTPVRTGCGPPTTRVAVLPHDPAVAAGRVQVQLLAHQVAEAGGVQVGAGANHAVARETAQLPRHVGQDVHWEVGT